MRPAVAVWMKPHELRERAGRFAIEVAKLCDALPRDHRSQEVANQLHDSALSAAMNYRAACRAQTPRMFYAKLCVVVEEIDEAQGWLEHLIESGKSSDDRTRSLNQEATELLKIFSASKQTWLRNHPPSR